MVLRLFRHFGKPRVWPITARAPPLSALFLRFFVVKPQSGRIAGYAASGISFPRLAARLTHNA